jgi:hypothetical protein
VVPSGLAVPRRPGGLAAREHDCLWPAAGPRRCRADEGHVPVLWGVRYIVGTKEAFTGPWCNLRREVPEASVMSDSIKVERLRLVGIYLHSVVTHFGIYTTIIGVVTWEDLRSEAHPKGRVQVSTGLRAR